MHIFHLILKVSFTSIHTYCEFIVDLRIQLNIGTFVCTQYQVKPGGNPINLVLKMTILVFGTLAQFGHDNTVEAEITHRRGV